MLTADQLQITPAEYESLITLRNALEADALPSNFRFNMAVSARVSDDHECRSVACIGGSIFLMMSMGATTDPSFALAAPRMIDLANARAYVDSKVRGSTLTALFFPSPLGDSRVYPPYSIYTRADAARAITNFLETGKPDWKTAAAGSIAKHEEQDSIAHHYWNS